MTQSGNPITAADVAKVARLARLDIDDAQVEHFTEQLVKVMGHFGDIDALDLSSVEPMTQPYPLVNVMRDDVVISTNIPTRLDGLPRSNVGKPQSANVY